MDGLLHTFSPSEGPMSDYQRWKAAARAMIEQLPETGSTIIVITQANGQTLKQGIAELRGKTVATRCRFVPVSRSDHLVKLGGLRGPVAVDPMIWMKARKEVVLGVSEAVTAATIVSKGEQFPPEFYG